MPNERKNYIYGRLDRFLHRVAKNSSCLVVYLNAVALTSQEQVLHPKSVERGESCASAVACEEAHWLNVPNVEKDVELCSPHPDDSGNAEHYAIAKERKQGKQGGRETKGEQTKKHTNIQIKPKARRNKTQRDEKQQKY